MNAPKLIRKVRFPFKFKFITILTILLIASISFYVFFALDLFKKDKSAYIYETGFSTTQYLTSQVSNYLRQAKNTVNLLSKAYESGRDDQFLKVVFNSNPNIVEFSIYQNGKKLLNLQDPKVLESYSVSKNYFSEILLKKPIPFETISETDLFLENCTLKDGIPHMLLGMQNKRGNRFFIARLSLSDLMNTFRKDNVYQTFVINRVGDLFIHGDAQQMIDNKKRGFFDEIIRQKINQGVQEFVEKGEEFIVAYNKINAFNLIVVSTIPQKTAYKVASFLMSKSLYFGAFLLSISVLIGIFFSRSLTSHIGKLFGATQKIAEGDFTSQVEIKSRDEIGALSDSFNFMSKEIVRYMEEMKEKARVENELAVAQLVQSTFFPDNYLDLPGMEVSAFYTPATECGGDWWGYIQHQDKTIIILADATGHGVPAALLTATANCCCDNLKTLATLEPSFLDSPAKILSFMNQAVCSVGGKIMMTCFVAVIDSKFNRICYSNASHNPPLHFQEPGGAEVSKANFKPMMGAVGPRLGHQNDATFDEETTEINQSDAIIFYTDGIVECTNPEGKQWGQRNFIKSLVKNIKNKSELVRDNVIAEARDFYNENPFEDDVTFIVAKLK